jgi:pilus assembly protein CpaE
MTHILVLAAGDDTARRISVLEGHEVVVVEREIVEKHARVGDIDMLLSRESGMLPEIVVLGEAMVLSEVLQLAIVIDRLVPTAEIMLVGEPSAETAFAAMRAGVREIIGPNTSDDELAQMLHRAANNVSDRLKPHLTSDVEGAVARSTTVVVMSAKGGVGKSTVATALSVGLARRAPMSTVLVDLDIQFGDAATLLDLAPEHSIADAFGSAAAMDTLILKTFLTAHPAGFYVLAGDESPTVGDHVRPADVKHLLKQLASQFRYVVVDTGAGLSDHTLAALEESDEVVVVSSMDVTSIRAVRKELDVLGELDLLPRRRHILLNFADRNAGLTVHDVENVVGLPVSVVVPRSPDVTVAGNRGESLMLAKKPGPVAKAVGQLVAMVAEDEPGGSASGRKARKARKSQKLGRRRIA